MRMSAGSLLLVTLGLAPLAAQIPGGRTLNVQTADAVYAKSANCLYALLTSGSPQYPQSLIAINPDDLTILGSTSLPQPAGFLRITDDGRYLYAVTATAPSVVYRISAATMAIEATWTPLFSDSVAPSQQQISDLLPVRVASSTRIIEPFRKTEPMIVRRPPPADNQTFIAAFRYDTTYVGTAAFDGERRRPITLSSPLTYFGFTHVSELVATEDPALVYGYDGLSSAWTTTRIRVTRAGLINEGFSMSAAWGFGRPLQVFRGLLYASNGTVFDVERNQQLGWFNSSETANASAFAIDEDHNLIYFTTRSERGISYYTHDLATFLPVSRLRVENSSAGDFRMPYSARGMLLTTGGDLVVFDGIESRLIFIPVSALPRYAPWQPPPTRQVAEGLRLMPYPASYLEADLANHRLLATFQGRVPGAGNSMLTIDPVAGALVSSVFVGAEPGDPAASPSGAYVYVPLMGQSSIRRFRTVDSQSDLDVRLYSVSDLEMFTGNPVQAIQVLPLPSAENSFAVIQGWVDGIDPPGFNSLVVYDGAVRRSQSLTQHTVAIDSGGLSRDGSQLFGLNCEDTLFEFSQVGISTLGASLQKKVSRLGSNFFETISCDGILCATTLGTVIDAAAAVVTAHINASGPVLADQSLGRIYMLVSTTSSLELREYDAKTAQLLRKASFPTAGGVYSLCRWADGEFAALTDAGILLISGQALIGVP